MTIAKLFTMNPIMFVWLPLSLVFTFMNTVAPKFTLLRFVNGRRNVFSAGTVTSLFVHSNWAHFLLNMAFICGSSIIISLTDFRTTNQEFVRFIMLVVTLIFAVGTGVVCLIADKSVEGSSGVASLLFSFVCIYHFKYIIGPVLVVGSLIAEIISSRKYDNVSHGSHIAGTIIGTLLAIIIWIAIK